ncbi:MAG: PD-(D/E)XK nuclease family protein, partial [Wolbachia pipientis]|nr:PD-(D/E)XK nuclease family protein [Wolbachia pipientis]
KKDQHIILIGIEKSEIYKLLIKAIYNLPLGKIILPHLNLKIKEKDWKSLDKRHYQYSMKDLLNYLNVNRKNVSFLEQTHTDIASACKTETCDKMTIEQLNYIFDTTTDLSKVSNRYIKNIEVITCDSREEETQIISLIIENEGYKNVSLIVLDKLLATRITCLLKPTSENYSYITLLVYTIKVLTSNWNSVALLALLKHKLVTFGFSQEKYNKILSELEIKILRDFNTNGMRDIINAINTQKKLKYKEDILIIFNKLKIIFNLLANSINYSISYIITTHLQCINMLSNINLLKMNNEIGNFIYDFLNACTCKSITIKCSLELYEQILMLLLKKEFFSIASNSNKLSLYHNKVVILAGFYDIPSFQNPFLNASIREKFNFPSVQEEQGYFLYTLFNLFATSKVYITRLVNSRKPTILSRLETLLVVEKTKYSYRDWLKILNTPECIVPYTQPTPKPHAKARKEKMQIMSCSAVEKLIRNPYSFYVEYILNIKQLKDLNYKPSILEFSTMIHSILERHLCNRRSLISIAHKVFSSSQFNFSSMWWVRMQKIIQSFIKFNKNRNNHTELEKKFSYSIANIPTHNDSHIFQMNKSSILLTARCDRVEHLSSGQVAIIDYKLGSPPSKKEVISGFFPQLILQALAVEHTTKKEVSELVYWKLDYDKITVITLKDFKLKMQEFKKNLPSFLFNYLKEIIPFTASPYFNRFLRFNNYKQLERIEEWL